MRLKNWSSYFTILLVSGLVFPGFSACLEAQSTLPTLVVHKTPTCGCCSNWIDHVKAAGFPVEVHDHQSLALIKAENGVDVELRSCHTATVAGYVIEGHVPADDIIRLVTEKPDIKGIAVPGMPIGSPGMEQGPRVQPYRVVSWDEAGSTAVFAEYGS